MKKAQNIYDNENFFKDYSTMRDNKVNANELIEIPTMKALLPNLKDKAILDLGCGAGGMAKYFIEQGAKYVLCLDISENMINLAQNSVSANNVEFKVMGMEELSSLNKKFDIVFSSLAFHYIKDFNKLINDIGKLLNENGILLFSQEHPLATAFVGNKELDNHIELQGKRYYLVKDYSNNGKREVLWNNENVIKYHRNYEIIINTLVNNGFRILQIDESKASEEVIKLVPKYIYQQDRPYFLFIKAEKN